jgi:hypothetical protein
MELLGATFPLLIAILPKKYDAASIQAMADAFRPYHARQQHFAVMHIQLKGVGVPTATERKLVTDWANSPAIRDVSARFCVVSAVVLPNPLNRGVLTAINWLLKPVCPTVPVGTAIAGVDECLDRLQQAGVTLPRSADTLRKEAHALLSARRDLADA